MPFYLLSILSECIIFDVEINLYEDCGCLESLLNFALQYLIILIDSPTSDRPFD